MAKSLSRTISFDCSKENIAVREDSAREVFLARLAVLWTQQALKECESRSAQATAKCSLLERNCASLQESIRKLGEEKNLLEREKLELRRQLEAGPSRTKESPKQAEQLAWLQKQNGLLQQAAKVSEEQNALLKQRVRQLESKAEEVKTSVVNQSVTRARQFQLQSAMDRLAIKHKKELEVQQIQLTRLREENRLLGLQVERLSEHPAPVEDDKLDHLRRVIKLLEDRLEEMFESKKAVVAEYNTLKGQYIELKALFAGGRSLRVDKEPRRKFSLAGTGLEGLKAHRSFIVQP